jgi:predicted PurR-regulated permease PerM
VTEPASTQRWPTTTLLRAIALFFAFLVVLRFVWLARTILIITFLGILFGLALSTGVDWLERRRVRRALGAPAIAVAFLSLLFGIGALIAPTLKEQSRELQEKLPQSLDQIDRWLGRKTAALAETVSPAPPGGQPETAKPGEQPETAKPGQQPETAKSAEQTQARQPAAQRREQTPEQQRQQGARARRSLREQIAAPLRSVAGYLFPFISTAFAAILAVILILFIAIYVAVDPGLYHQGILHLIPHRRRKRVDEVLCNIEDVLRRWLIARLIAMVVIGAVTTGILMLLKVRAAAALGLIAGVLEFIPFFGPIVSAVPAVAIGMLDSPQKGIYVVLAFIVIQQLEGNLLTPLLLQNRVHIPALLTIFSVTAMGAVLGIGGMLIAEPLLAATLIAVQMLYVEDVIGDRVHDPPEKC